ncbi:MAG: T9SS type A sorting domain-containing protein [Chitinophagaceae bacterium]|nr:T9SS type A sorting domain-containing protein [Chitinophagaceae bacterium]
MIIQGTGGYEFRVFSNGSGGSLNVSSDINVSGGKLSLINSSSVGSGSAIVNVAGNVTVSGTGVLDLTGSGSATSGASSLNIAGNLTVSGTGKLLRTQVVTSTITFNKSSGTQTFNSIAGGTNTNDIIFNIGTGSSTNTLQMNSDFAMSAGGSLSILSGATLDCGTYVVSGGSINVNSGSTIRTSNANGFANASSSGSVQTTTRTYNSAATYVFNGTTNQSTGDFFLGTTTPNNVSTIEIANTGTSPNNIVTLLVSGPTATTLRLTAGLFSSGAGNVLNIGTNGFVTNNGGNIDSSSIGGTISFVGAGTVNGTTATTFRNVNINAGAVNIPIGATIPLVAGSLQINGGNLTNPPKYGSASTLIYNTSYDRYVEWNYVGIGTIATSAGYPNNVTIADGTFDVYNNATGEARACNGTLTINNDAILNCNNMNSTLTVGDNLVIAIDGSFNMNTMSAALIVNDNISISGTLSLSTDFNGSLYLGGNWTRNSTGTFIPNSRAVFFIGSADQTITLTGGGIESFPYFCIDKQNAGTYVMPDNSIGNQTDLNISGTSGNVLQLLNEGGLDLNGRSCTIVSNNIVSIQVTGGERNIISSIDTGLFIIAGAAFPPTPFVNSSDITSTLVFDSGVRIELNGGFNFSEKISTVNGTLRINSGAYVTGFAPLYGMGSRLQYYTNGVFNRTIEWGEAADQGYPYNVQISKNSTLSPGGSSNTGIVLNLANDLTIDAGSELTMNYAGNNMMVPLIVGNDILINGELTLSDQINGDVKVGGAWTRNSTTGNFYPQERAAFFNGSSLQTISVSPSGTETFDYLIIDNSGAGVSLSATDIQVNDILTLSNGLVNTGSNEVYVANNAGMAITGYQTDPAAPNLANYLGSSYINGNLRRAVTADSNYVFPVGTSSSYQYDSISLIKFAGASNILCFFTAGNVCTDPATQMPAVTVLGTPITNLLLGGYWTMTSDAPLTAVEYDITLQESLPFLDLASDDSSYAIIKRDDCASDWEDEGLHDDATQISYPNVATAQVVRAYRDSVTSFSDIAIGYNDFFLLPVELTNFTVSLTNGISVLEWSTASEYNSHYFSIESSEDAINFKEIGRMNAAGFSTVAQYYSFNDENDVTSGATRIYYRLRMVDTDQTYQYSAVRWVDLDETTVAESITIFPNPVKDLLSVKLYSATEQSALIELTEITGKLIRRENIQLHQGYNFLEINRFDEVADGIYLLKVTADRNYYTRKVVKE